MMPGGLPSVEGVILAAGTSHRAGTFKPSLMIGGQSMISRSIAGMSRVCRRLIVVGGHEFERLRLLVENTPGVVCVENPAYREGMFTSVKTGLSLVRAARCFVLPADIPLVPHRVYEQLLSVDAEVAIPVYRGRTGHPVLCSAKAVRRILREPDASVLRDVLGTIGFVTVPVDAEEILLDIDTPEDLENVRGRFLKNSDTPNHTLHD